MIIIAGYTRTEAGSRDAAVETFREMVECARAHDGCLDFSISADVVDPERVNPFERWRDQAALNSWRKVAKGPRGIKLREAHVNLYRTEKAEKPF
ncbi:MAG TPA: antibiotic biosynthesis monooxygenase [Sphingomicrobium sp.]